MWFVAWIATTQHLDIRLLLATIASKLMREPDRAGQNKREKPLVPDLLMTESLPGKDVCMVGIIKCACICMQRIRALPRAEKTFFKAVTE